MWSKLKIYSVSIGIAIVVLIVASIVIVVFKPDKEVEKSDDFNYNHMKRTKNSETYLNGSEKVSQFELEFDDDMDWGNIVHEVDGQVHINIPGSFADHFQFPSNIGPSWQTNQPNNLPDNMPNNKPNIRPEVTQMLTQTSNIWNNNKGMKYTTLTEEEVTNEFGGDIGDGDGGADYPPQNAGADAGANAGANAGDKAGAGADTGINVVSNHALNSECLSAQNEKRRKHGVSDLVLDNSLMEIAKKRAIELKNDNKLETKPDMKYGENLYVVTRRRQTYKCSKAVQVWYKEIKNYNFDDPTKSSGVVGHFTQLIWKSSQKVGCAQAYNEIIKKLYTVCIYYPPGNYKGQLKNNVLNIRPDNRPVNRPDNRPVNRPDNRPVNRPDNRPDNRPVNRPNNVPNNRPVYKPNIKPMVTQIVETIRPNIWNNNKEKKYTTLTPEEVRDELNKMFGGVIGGGGANNPPVNAGANTGSNNQDLNTQCLISHNERRRKHGVPELVIDKSLIDFAKNRALTLKTTNKFAHEDDSKYGENLHYISPHKTYPCNKIVDAWYREIKDYNFNEPEKSVGMIGHFTQLIWKTSLRVGCAQAYSDSSQKLYTACNYDPPGNYKGEQKENVPRAI